MQNTESIINMNSDDSDSIVLLMHKKLLNMFQLIEKLSHMHDINNVALQDPLNKFVDALIYIFSDFGSVSLEVAGDCIYINESKIRMDVELFAAYSSVLDVFDKYGLGGIFIQSEVKPDDIKKFFEILKMSKKSEDPFAVILDEIAKADLNISIDPTNQIYSDLKAVDRKDEKEVAKRTYVKTLSVVSEAMDSVKGKQVFNIKESKKVVQKMVDNILQDESTLLGLSTLKCYDEYTYNHSVNVCILALAMGQRLGYTKAQLGELGMAALFHDIGKSSVPIEVLNKSEEFTTSDWNQMRKHPVFGVRKLIKLKGVNRLTLKILSGAFEHHLNYDLSGYPVLKKKWDVSLYGRIISVVDCYDALTDSRVYNRTPFTPYDALKYMLAKSGSAFDPILIKVFLNILGIYPVGSLVILDSRELAVVVKCSIKHEFMDKPFVRIIHESGKPNDYLTDLAEKDDKGDFKKTIIKAVNSHKYGMSVTSLLVQ